MESLLAGDSLRRLEPTPTSVRGKSSCLHNQRVAFLFDSHDAAQDDTVVHLAIMGSPYSSVRLSIGPQP